MTTSPTIADRRRSIIRVSSEDRQQLADWGKTWGRSLVLLPEYDNIDAIREGPSALGSAADYYATAVNHNERYIIIEEFYMGMKLYTSRVGMVQLEQHFRELSRLHIDLEEKAAS